MWDSLLQDNESNLYNMLHDFGSSFATFAQVTKNLTDSDASSVLALVLVRDFDSLVRALRRSSTL